MGLEHHGAVGLLHLAAFTSALLLPSHLVAPVQLYVSVLEGHDLDVCLLHGVPHCRVETDDLKDFFPTRHRQICADDTGLPVG